MIGLTVAGSNLPALIDDAYAHLVGFRWRLDKDGYVMRRSAGRRVYLHHEVLPGSRYPAYHRDHENRDKLDNRSRNLRWLTAAESQQNKGPYKCNESGYRGVRFVAAKGQFLATIQMGGKALVRRWFNDASEANGFLTEQRACLMPKSYPLA